MTRKMKHTKNKRKKHIRGMVAALMTMAILVLAGTGGKAFLFLNKSYAAASERLRGNIERGTISELCGETETESESDTELCSETVSETEFDKETETESEPETWEETERESAVEDEREPETEIASESELEQDNGSASEAESETETESESESEPESESTSEAESETETESALESEPESESASEAEPETEIESASESKSEDESASEAERELETESESEPETEGESASETESELETESESEPETEGESASETESELESESKSEVLEEPEVGNESESETVGEAWLESGSQSEFESELEEKDEENETDNNDAGMNNVGNAKMIERGVHYEITGDAGAWYYDAKDQIWVRAGTSLSVQPIAGSGYNLGESLDNLQTDGSFSFTLKKIKKDGTIVEESAVAEETYYVDGEAPSARFQISGNKQGTVIYAAQSCTVTVTVEPDGKSGLKSISYKIMACDSNGSVLESADETAWTTCASNAVLQISREGLFRVYVMTVDMVGNIAYSRSDVICVDQTIPTITITGVGDQTANADSVNLYVECSDTYYKSGSLNVNIVGANQGNAPTVRERGNLDRGEWIAYYDFPELKSYDDVYEVTVTAEDLAGNISEKTIQFSVNRFGSAYDLSSVTKSILDEYYLKEACEIVFYETNIDYVGESVIYCRHDGVLRQLQNGTDYQVTMEGSEKTWKRYCYTVFPSCFLQEGVYELLLVSQDLAENQSDTGIQQKRVTFVLDWTAPTCTVSGIQNGGIYEEDIVTVYVIPNDNLGLSSMKIYHNSELLAEDAAFPVSGKALRFSMESESEWQTMQVWLCDRSGNEYWSEEIVFFVGSAQQEVPLYEKTRKSARELALEAEKEGSLTEDAQAESQLSAADTGDKMEETDFYNMVEGIPDTQLSQAMKTTSDAGELRTKAEHPWIGWVVLLAGILIFAGTVFSIYPGRTKRFK